MRLTAFRSDVFGYVWSRSEAMAFPLKIIWFCPTKFMAKLIIKCARRHNSKRFFRKRAQPLAQFPTRDFLWYGMNCCIWKLDRGSCSSNLHAISSWTVLDLPRPQGQPWQTSSRRRPAGASLSCPRGRRPAFQLTVLEKACKKAANPGDPSSKFRNWELETTRNLCDFFSATLAVTGKKISCPTGAKWSFQECL